MEQDLAIERYSRSREGARIEIPTKPCNDGTKEVAPARERGLKFEPMGQSTANPSRSREGARIEMTASLL